MKHLTPEQRMTVENMHLVTSDQMQMIESALTLVVAAIIARAYDALVSALRTMVLTINDKVALVREIAAAAVLDLRDEIPPYIDDLVGVAVERSLISAALMTTSKAETIIAAARNAGIDDRGSIVAAVTEEVIASAKATALHPIAGFGNAAMMAGLGAAFAPAAQVAALLDESVALDVVPEAIASAGRATIIARAAATRTDNVVSVMFGDRMDINRYVNIGVPDQIQCDTCWLASEQDQPLTLDQWNSHVLIGRFRPVPWQARVKVRNVHARVARVPQRHRHCRCRLSAYDLTDELGIAMTGRRYGEVEAFLRSQYGTARERGVIQFR